MENYQIPHQHTLKMLDNPTLTDYEMNQKNQFFLGVWNQMAILFHNLGELYLHVTASKLTLSLHLLLY